MSCLFLSQVSSWQETKGNLFSDPKKETKRISQVEVIRDKRKENETILCPYNWIAVSTQPG